MQQLLELYQKHQQDTNVRHDIPMTEFIGKCVAYLERSLRDCVDKCQGGNERLTRNQVLDILYNKHTLMLHRLYVIVKYQSLMPAGYSLNSFAAMTFQLQQQSTRLLASADQMFQIPQQLAAEPVLQVSRSLTCFEQQAINQLLPAIVWREGDKADESQQTDSVEVFKSVALKLSREILLQVNQQWHQYAYSIHQEFLPVGGLLQIQRLGVFSFVVSLQMSVDKPPRWIILRVNVNDCSLDTNNELTVANLLQQQLDEHKQIHKAVDLMNRIASEVHFERLIGEVFEMSQENQIGKVVVPDENPLTIRLLLLNNDEYTLALVAIEDPLDKLHVKDYELSVRHQDDEQRVPYWTKMNELMTVMKSQHVNQQLNALLQQLNFDNAKLVQHPVTRRTKLTIKVTDTASMELSVNTLNDKLQCTVLGIDDQLMNAELTADLNMKLNKTDVDITAVVDSFRLLIRMDVLHRALRNAFQSDLPASTFKLIEYEKRDDVLSAKLPFTVAIDKLPSVDLTCLVDFSGRTSLEFTDLEHISDFSLPLQDASSIESHKLVIYSLAHAQSVVNQLQRLLRTDDTFPLSKLAVHTRFGGKEPSEYVDRLLRCFRCHYFIKLQPSRKLSRVLTTQAKDLQQVIMAINETGVVSCVFICNDQQPYAFQCQSFRVEQALEHFSAMSRLKILINTLDGPLPYIRLHNDASIKITSVKFGVVEIKWVPTQDVTYGGGDYRVNVVDPHYQVLQELLQVALSRFSSLQLIVAVLNNFEQTAP